MKDRGRRILHALNSLMIIRCAKIVDAEAGIDYYLAVGDSASQMWWAEVMKTHASD